MRKKYITILLLATAGTLLIGGCQQQDTENAPAAVPDLSAPSESPIDVDILSETIDGSFTETSEAPTAEQASTAEPTPRDDAQETRITDNAPSDATVSVTKAFQPNDGWTSDFFFQLPQDWNYTIDEDTFEWGFLIQVNNQDDASIRIYGQQGTVNVEQFYADAPAPFETSCGLKGKYYQEKRTDENGSSYVEGDIVFDLKLYGVHFYMPETVYAEYKDTLQKIFLSIKIEDIIAE